MSRIVVKGSTDQSVLIRILNTDGTPKTDVEHNTSGLALSYRREGGNVTSITTVALAAANTAHTDGGIEHIFGGIYRVDPPDAAFASGANGVVVGGTLTSAIIIPAEVPLVDFNIYSATPGVSLGTDAITATVLAASAANEIRDAILAGVIETVGSRTLQQALSVILAAVAGRTAISGSTVELRTTDGSAARATITMSGNQRSASVLNPSA